MDQKRWKKIEGLLDEALDRVKPDRENYLKNVLRNDPELYREVVSLLHNIEKADEEDFLGE